MNIILWKTNKVSTVSLMIAVLLPAVANAQTGFFAIPSVSIMEVYDDNLFFSLESEESDLATRISPALELGYDSERTTWNARYSFDSEIYNQNEELDSTQARKFADFTVNFLRNERLTLSADAHYIKTNTPLDLRLEAGGAIPGLLLERFDAERSSLHPVIDFQFTPATSGSLAYTLTHDRLFGAIDSDTHFLETGFEHELSNINTLRFGYKFRHYRFDDRSTDNGVLSGTVNQDTHTPWVGLQHEFTPQTSVIAEVGPRIYEDSIDPYLLLSLRHTYPEGVIDLSYDRNETTLLGETGRVEAETVSLEMTRQIGANFQVQLGSGYAQVSHNEFSVDIYRVGLDAQYRITDAFYLSANYDLNYQEVDFIGGDVDTVSRSVILLGFTLTYPRRTEQEPL